VFESLKQKATRTTIARSIQVLSRRDKLKVGFVVILQIGLGLLDLAGVAIIGILGALAVSGVSSREPGNRVYSVLNFLNLETLTLQQQATLLGVAAALLLVGKTVISIIFTRKIIFFLSRRGAVISKNLLSRLLAQPLQNLQQRSMQQNLYAVTSGVNTITVGILSTCASLIADISLLVVMTIGLFVVDTIIAISTLMIFGAIGFALYKLMNKRAQQLGIELATLNIESNQKITEILGSYREAVVRNRRSFYAREIGRQRLKISEVGAEIAFMPNIGKYVIELTVVIGSLGISAAQFRMQDAAHAVAVLAVFIAASTRIAPAVLRVQQGAISIKTSLGGATPTLELIESLADASYLDQVSDLIETKHSGFQPRINAENLTITYPTKTVPAVDNASFDILEGQFVAVVGTSGAGKTTLIDMLLGVLVPNSGSVKISGYSPIESIAKWPGAISYVPQDVLITQGTIRENVAMGFPIGDFSDELVWQALSVAQLEDFARGLPQGLDSLVGDRGVKISGGQRQRLGIARAMFTKPKLLVLDEATSSLDGQTEADVSESISLMHGKVTVIMIAHRLSTVRSADKVIYMDSGMIKAIGTFAEVRSSVPDFDRQAQLMGL
jgi:ABC-type multidrug transport system fused ATPase/permease subunit